MSTIGFEQHDHSDCIQGGLKAVEKACSTRGLQFTPVRKRVMELLLEGHRAMGAYEILDVLRDEGLGSQPPVAYRALDFLVSSGFAHRIERLNAFTACMHPGEDHTAAFLICRACDAVAEAYADPAKGLLGGAAQQTGFEVETAVIEAVGLCPNCQKSPST
ncbi:transcriptional repressor [Roseovarius sp. A21]|uniref:Transcriptional repressor n=1 Tax=Roseovarius bejariae TaxID=2576383 RepID=A0A844CV91_9RHOB|nr:transcriptional repressor [Roseovarius bejariae]MRU15969.1 transcriptional repressor [Roseovarius bejariae]